MYRQALAAAAEARGWDVRWYDRARLPAGKALAALGRTAGRPWNAQHRQAAAAALGWRS